MGLQAATSVTAELLITEVAEKPVSEASTPRVSICSRSRHFSPGSAAPDICLRAIPQSGLYLASALPCSVEGQEEQLFICFFLLCSCRRRTGWILPPSRCRRYSAEF